MKNAEFEAFAQRQGLSVVGAVACGFIGDFPVLVNQLNGFVTVVWHIDEGQVKGARKALKDPLKELKSAATSTAKDQIQITLNPKKRDIDGDYRRMSEIVLDVFGRLNIAPVDRCPICGYGACDSAVLHSGSYRRVHRNCAENTYQSTVQRAEGRATNNNYLTGILGALIGGLVAAMPAMLMIWFLESVNSLLYALIPLGAYHGYRNLKGKMDHVAIGIVVVVSIFYGIFIDILTLLGYFIIEGIPLRVFFYMMGEGGMFAEMIPEFLMNLLFIGFGLFITWKQISRTDSTEMKEAGLTMETLQPLRAANAVDERFAPQAPYTAGTYSGPEQR